MSLSSVVKRIPVPHGLRDGASRLDLHQRTFANTRAPVRRPEPLALVVHELRPERKCAALQRFRRMNRTTIGFQKNALHMARNPQAPQILRAIDVAAFKNGLRHFDEGGKTGNVFLGQIDEALLFATLGATGLAFESQFWINRKWVSQV
jgi:hypothetical protein